MYRYSYEIYLLHADWLLVLQIFLRQLKPIEISGESHEHWFDSKIKMC